MPLHHNFHEERFEMWWNSQYVLWAAMVGEPMVVEVADLEEGVFGDEVPPLDGLYAIVVGLPGELQRAILSSYHFPLDDVDVALWSQVPTQGFGDVGDLELLH